MVQVRGYFAGVYDFDILCAALRIKPGTWMPLRRMSEQDFTDFREELTRQDEYPHVYEARLVDGMSEVRTRVLKRRVTWNTHTDPVRDWEVDPSILRDNNPFE